MPQDLPICHLAVSFSFSFSLRLTTTTTTNKQTNKDKRDKDNKQTNNKNTTTQHNIMSDPQDFPYTCSHPNCLRRFKTPRGRSVHFGATHGVSLSISNSAANSHCHPALGVPPREALMPFRRSTRLASVALEEPQESGAGDVGDGDGASHQQDASSVTATSTAASLLMVPGHPSNPFAPFPDSIIDRISTSVDDMLGLDVSQCFNPETDLLQHLPNHHIVLAELSFLMDSAGAPKYLLDLIISHIRTAASHRGFDLLSCVLPTRSTLMNSLQSVISVPAPVSVPVPLETGQISSVLTNCFPSLFQHHLLSDAYSDLSNLDLPDPALPFSSKPAVDPPGSSSIIDSRWYQLTYRSHQTVLDSGSAILLPLLLYIDKTGVDQIMKNSVEPLVCTSALLSQSARQDPNNWFILGYLPSMLPNKRRPVIHDQWTPKRSSSQRDYHRCLGSILSQLKTIQHRRCTFRVRRGSSVRPMRIICPVVSILGDNLSQNLLCGKLENKTSSSSRMSRCCLTSNSNTDSLPHVCHPFPVLLELQLTNAALGVGYGFDTPSFTSSNLEAWKQFQTPSPFSRTDGITLRKLREKIADLLLKSVLGSHCIVNSFHGVDFGAANSVVPATSADIMHSFESGILKLVLSILLDPLCQSDINAIDRVVEQTFGSCGPNRSGQFPKYPRVSFLRGFCSLSLLSSSERVGQLFVVALLMNTRTGQTLFSNRFSDNFDDENQFPTEEAPPQEDLEAEEEEPDEEEEQVHPPVANLGSVSPPFYSRADQSILLGQLQLGFFLQNLHQLSAGHRQVAHTILDKVFSSRRRLLDRLLSAVGHDPSFQVLAGADLDYQPPFMQLVPLSSPGGLCHPALLEWDIPTPMSHPPAINPSRDACSISLDPCQFKDLVELMLCFHATLKYGTNIFSCGTREKIVAYQTNFHKMMLYIIDGLKRPSASNQFRLQKFLECCHFLQEHLFKGPPCAHNTDVGERGLKKWAKAPAKTAQNRGDSVFKQQVARNNHEAGLLHAVVAEFSPDLLRRQKSHVTEDIVSATGTTFVFVFRASICGFFKRVDSSKSDLLQCHEILFPGPIKQWFVSKFSSFYNERSIMEEGYEIIIPIFTELVYSKAMDGRKEDLRLRAHPNFYGGPWYDYAWIRYSFEDIDQGLYPARCACFFKLPTDMPTTLTDCIAQVEVPESTVMVLVQECDYQTTMQQQHDSMICTKWTLQSTYNPSQGTVTAKLKCMTHECVSDGLFAFDDDVDGSKSVDSFTKRRGDGGRCVFDVVAVSNRQSNWANAFVTI